MVVVDNDRDALALAVLDLTLEGHDIVATGTSGEEAVDACQRHQPDVLVVDYRMPPGATGLVVARRSRDHGLPIRIVLCTNYDEAEVTSTAADLGVAVVAKGNLLGLRRAVAA